MPGLVGILQSTGRCSSLLHGVDAAMSLGVDGLKIGERRLAAFLLIHPNLVSVICERV